MPYNSKLKEAEFLKRYREKNAEKMRDYQKAYRKKHSEEIKKKEKLYREKNAEKRKEYQKAYREKNAEKRKDYHKQYLIENAEKIKEYRLKHREKQRNYNREYKLKNKEKTKEYQKEYREKNKEKIKKAKREEYLKKRRKTDDLFKIIQNLRGRVKSVLKTQNAKKFKKTLDLIGCTPEFLKHYLESKFQEGMSWENYGKFGWHIDHIIPCSSFNMLLEEDQKKCFHYTNLQPLWWLDNLKKGNKIV